MICDVGEALPCYPAVTKSPEGEVREMALREADEIEEKRSGVERRRDVSNSNPWANPALWVSITGILLTVCIFMASLLLSELKSINANLTRGIVSDATTELRVSALEKENERLQNKIDTVEKAYRYDFNKRLPAIEAALKLKPPPEQEGD